MLLGASLGLLIGILFADFFGRRLVIIYSITLISEIVAEKNRSKSFVILNIGFATGTVANTILFLLVRNWTYVIIFYYVLFHVIALVVFTYYV